MVNMMHFPDGIDLLPEREKRALRMRYYFGLATIGAFMLALAVFAGAALLVPSYLLSKNQAESAERYFAAERLSAAQSDSSGTGRDVALLSERLSILKKYERQPAVADILSRIGTDAAGAAGLTIISMTFNANGSGTTTVSGTAPTRAALLSFGDKLSKESAFVGAQVPVSDLASDAALPFTIPFGYAPSPH